MACNCIEEGILNDMTIAVSERLSFVGSRDETGRKTREKPSLAQVAGIAAYWMAKLKPCFMDADSPNKLYVVNEVAAIFLGLSICLHSRAKIPQTTPALDERLMNSLKKRILNDWVTTLRYYNNSTDSLVLPFNIIISSQKL